jgi:hypothetical protein
MRKQEKQPWNPFPLAVLSAGEKFDLTPAAISVLIYLGARSNWKGETCVGHTRMCADLRRSKDFVTTALKELYVKGVVKADGRTRHKGQADWRIISQSVLPCRNTAEGDQSCPAGQVSPEEQDYDIPAYQSQTLQIKQEPNLTEGNLSDSRKEVTKEPLLASLEAECSAASPEEKTNTNPTELSSEEPEENQNQDTPDLHPSVWSLERMWKERTGYLFTDADKVLAHKLIIAYRYRVVEAVLRNTLFMRKNSAKLRWNKFSIFAKHWQRNHEEYLAWCATGYLDKGRGYSSHSPAQKFDTVPNDDQIDTKITKEWNSLVAWLKEHKQGDWQFGRQDWEAMGLHRGHVYVVLRYLADEGVAATKVQLIDLLFEAAGVKAVGAAARFDLEEA